VMSPSEILLRIIIKVQGAALAEAGNPD